MIRDNVAKSRPDLKEALEKLEQQNTSQPDQDCDPAPEQEEGVYRLNFGEHEGKTLQEVVDESSLGPEYIAWLIRDDVAKNRPNLKEALELHLNPTRKYVNPDWQPPSLDIMPQRFLDGKRGPMWISAHNTREYFPLQNDYSTVFPWVQMVDGLDLTVLSVFNDPKYWLFHVWDFVRVHWSQEDADEALDEYLRRRRPAEVEIREELRYYGMDEDGNVVGEPEERGRRSEDESEDGGDEEEASDDSIE